MGTLSQFPFLLFFSLTLNLCSSASDYTTLIFKGCASQNFQTLYKPTLTSLLTTLTSQSSASKFHVTTSPSPTSITALYQCRGDLTLPDCHVCISKTPQLAQTLCGQAMAARVQLNGCYLKYEVSGFRQISNNTEMIYRVCGSTRVNGDGFGERLSNALGEIVKGIGNNEGFYAAGYQGVYVLGQCQGDLSSGDCVECVKAAVQGAVNECGSSISGQVYLQGCFVRYTYYPSGVPRDGGGGGGSGRSSYSSGTGRNTQKTVAIVLGGLVGAGLVMACLLFAKSAFKKKNTHHTYKYGG